MTAAVFGIIVCGRLVQTEFQQVDQTHFIINVEDADNVNHVVVFLTGSQPLPDGMSASVYFSWPEPLRPPSWIYLGYISNQKPSAVFRVSTLKSDGTGTTEIACGHTPYGLQQQSSQTAQIGLSVEPHVQVSGLTPAPQAQPSRLPSFVQFADKMLQNFVNYASSFSVVQAQMVPTPNDAFVSLTVVQKWYENFQRRMQLNPNFWK